MELLHEQQKYYEAKLAECKNRPDLNAYQKKLFEEYVAKSSACSSVEELTDFIASRGNYFDIAQADQQDRYANMIKIQQFYKNKKREEYYAAKLETVKQATDHMSLSKNLTDIESKISEEEKKSTQAVQEVLNLYIKTVEYITAPDTKKNKYFAEVEDKWMQLKKLDPEISLDKILNYPPYRHVSIFEDERIVELFSNIREVMQ
jgi:lipopolysaccharide export LptBFGC system permease protein LptF